MKIAIILMLLIMTGCASTHSTSYVDPKYYNKKYSNYLIVTPSLSLEYSKYLQPMLCNKINDNDAKCKGALDLFLPTRSYDKAAITKTLKDNDFDGFLLITYDSNINNYKTDIIENTITAYSLKSSKLMYSRNDLYSYILYDLETMDKVMIGSSTTSAQGISSTTNDTFAASISRGIIKELLNNQLL
ncbi:MAG: hypothetical protein JAZ15_21945 [Candidatus Thiodiazotropha endolucinida]|nr:hypothetical protein [Candidatus Thiodiazotropha taylori]MCW4315680.1 hypothetical protein [Candidatus Thiodiazotropha taylori]